MIPPVATYPLQALGQCMEAFAREHLEAAGLKCIATGFKCKLGELDLLMYDGETLVVVEVRYRKNALWGGPLESVTHTKQAKIKRATEYYLQTQGRAFDTAPIRFDVLAITQSPPGVEWVKHAFD